MKKLLYSLSAALITFAPGALHAQRTGSFDTSVDFNGKPRAASMFVPAGYNAANKYRLMVCLHGLGDSCTTYRNSLINSLGWGTNMPNTIFIMPESETKTSDIYSFTGSEEIIRESMLFVMSQYHIDTANVVLQGFSLGGRAALRYGLDHPTMFKGLLLNTPAIQGVKEALNGHAAAYSFDYTNAYRIPIYITHGSTDIGYGAPIDSTYEQLVLNDAPVRLNRIAGMGHNVPPFTRMQDFTEFFDTPGHAGLDIDLVKLAMPARTCQSSVAPTLLVRNSGRDLINAGAVRISVNNGTPTTFTASGSGILPSFTSLEIPLPAQMLTAGKNTITVEVSQINGVADTVVMNNKVTDSIDYTAAGAQLPLNEDFEGSAFPPAGWLLEEAGDFYTAWAQDNVVAKTGSNSAGTFNTILYFDNAGRSEGLTSPVLNLQSANKPVLSFDLAYNYHRYTPPYFTADVNFADTLDVLVSTDCGDHYTSIFRKGGADLATFTQPIINPLDINSCYINPDATNWTRHSLSLSNYGTAQNAVIKFNYISALGGSINIDNVSVAAGTTGVKPAAGAAFRVYPNPATDKLTIDPGTEAVTQFVILDAAGRNVFSGAHQAQNMQPFTIDLRALPAGLYTVQMHTETSVRTTKLSVQH